MEFSQILQRWSWKQSLSAGTHLVSVRSYAVDLDLFKWIQWPNVMLLETSTVTGQGSSPWSHFKGKICGWMFLQVACSSSLEQYHAPASHVSGCGEQLKHYRAEWGRPITSALLFSLFNMNAARLTTLEWCPSFKMKQIRLLTGKAEIKKDLLFGHIVRVSESEVKLQLFFHHQKGNTLLYPSSLLSNRICFISRNFPLALS